MAIDGGLLAQSRARNATVRAVITRADGSVENLGVISFYHRNKFIQTAVNLWIKFKELLRNGRSSSE